jgi:hypothetical protein
MNISYHGKLYRVETEQELIGLCLWALIDQIRH